MDYSKNGIVKKHKLLVSSGRRISTKLVINIFRIFMLFLLLIGAAGVSLGLGVVSGILEETPEVEQISIAPSGVSTTVYDSEGNEIEKRAVPTEFRLHWIKYRTVCRKHSSA